MIKKAITDGSEKYLDAHSVLSDDKLKSELLEKKEKVHTNYNIYVLNFQTQ